MGCERGLLIHSEGPVWAARWVLLCAIYCSGVAHRAYSMDLIIGS